MNALFSFLSLGRRQKVKNAGDPITFQGRYGLTKMEMGVLGLLKGGQTHKEIAGVLNLSYHTVDTHVLNIFRKLEVQNFVGAVMKFVAKS